MNTCAHYETCPKAQAGECIDEACMYYESTITAPKHQCACGRGMVYNVGEQCSACQERHSRVMRKVRADLYGTAHTGWKRMGMDGCYVRAGHV